MNQTRTQGFILITVLLTMLLLATIGTALLLRSTSETKQVGFSQGQAQARAYAEAAQADMFYQLANGGVGIINAAIQPYSDAFAASSSNALTTPVIPTANYNALLTVIQPQFPAISSTENGYTTTSTIKFRKIRTENAGFTGSGTSQVQPYFIDYSITGKATQGLNLNTRTVITEGTLKIMLGRIPLNMYVLLAQDGGSGPNGTSGFFDNSSVYDGPVHVNGNLALSGAPVFRQGLSVSSPGIWMNNSRSSGNGTSCQGFNFTYVTGQQSSGCTVPNTGGNGIQFNTPPVPLPPNAAQQARASLGLDSNNLVTPTKAEICPALGLLSTCGSVPSGTYVPLTGGVPSGGIYVQGNATLKLSVVGGNQVYTVTDAQGVVTTVTTNTTARTTTVQKGNAAAVVYPGLLNGQVYVSGTLTSLSGPARTGNLPATLPTNSVPTQIPPALAADSKLNVAAGTGVSITGDLTYTDDPRSVANAQNVLGIISGANNVSVAQNAPKDLYVQAALLTGAPGTGLSVDNPGSGGNRGAIHLLGSLAEDTDQIRGYVNQDGTPSSGYADDLHFDQRFTNGAVSPPFFPASTKFAVNTSYPIQRT